MEDYVFEITDKTGRKIRLTKRQWRHIRRDHPDVTEEEMTLTVKNPLKTIEKRKGKHFYYQFFKYKKYPSKFLRVIVKYLNGEGHIITAYFVRDIS